MTRFLCILLLLSAFNGYSQQKQMIAYNRVKSLYLSTSLGCKEGKEQCSIFFNKNEKAIDIIDELLPLTKIEVRYRYSEMIPGVRHFVQFKCADDEDCIFDSKKNKYLNSLSVPFSSKQACYDFIDAISNLKENL